MIPIDPVHYPKLVLALGGNALIREGETGALEKQPPHQPGLGADRRPGHGRGRRNAYLSWRKSPIALRLFME